jgi:thymidylate kinase
LNPAGPKEVQPQHCPDVLLSFSGMDGSGKSTQIENLCNQLTEAGLPFVRLEFWDNVVAFPRWRAGFSHKFLKSDGGVGAPGKPVNRNDKNNRAWYLMLARSALFLFDALNLRRVVAKTRANGARIIVFDRYIFDQLATLPLERRAMARAYARLIMKLVPRPDVAYLLDAEPEVARERKPEYPLDFLYKYRRSYLCLRDIAGLTLIEARPQDEVRMAITQKLQKCVPLRGPQLDYNSMASV